MVSFFLHLFLTPLVISVSQAGGSLATNRPLPPVVLGYALLRRKMDASRVVEGQEGAAFLLLAAAAMFLPAGPCPPLFSFAGDGAAFVAFVLFSRWLKGLAPSNERRWRRRAMPMLWTETAFWFLGLAVFTRLFAGASLAGSLTSKPENLDVLSWCLLWAAMAIAALVWLSASKAARQDLFPWWACGWFAPNRRSGWVSLLADGLFLWMVFAFLANLGWRAWGGGGLWATLSWVAFVIFLIALSAGVMERLGRPRHPFVLSWLLGASGLLATAFFLLSSPTL